MVPACHDILVFGLCPDVARPMAAARSGSVQHSRSTKGLWGVKIDRLSVTRSRGSIDFCYPARRAGREDYLGEEASMGVMMGDEGW